MKTLLVILALLIAGCASAEATYWDTPKQKRVVKHKPKPKKVSKPAPVSNPRCAAPLTREGDQYATVEGAKSEANKAWMQAARWNLGEKYMDISHAEGVNYSCGRSSIGTVVGQSFHRCEVTARPCRAQGE